jgi:hypothetical protein
VRARAPRPRGSAAATAAAAAAFAAVAAAVAAAAAAARRRDDVPKRRQNRLRRRRQRFDVRADDARDVRDRGVRLVVAREVEQTTRAARAEDSGSFYTSDDIGVELKGVRSGVERRRGVSGLKPRDPGRRETNAGR